jgi:hypothetical protein
MNYTVKRRLHVWFQVTHCDTFAARIQLVKTENPSACVTVNCEECISVIALQLPVVQNCLYEVQ